MTFHAIYSRYTQKSSWDEAVAHIHGGEDDGMIFGIAVYGDAADLLYIPHPGFLSEADVRHDVGKVLGRLMERARTTPFPERAEENA